MKIKIKNFNGELPSYLTEGMVYEVEYVKYNTRFIKDDVGDFIGVGNDLCVFLNGGSWEIVDE